MSYGTSSMCVFCSQKPSTTSCGGCQRKFCFDCLSEHRKELSLELDDLVNRRNELFEIINNHLSNNTTGKCSGLDEINRWQQEMHTHIDRIASTARDNVRQLLSDASKTVRSGLDKVSQELQQKQKSGAYLEGDLNQIKQQLTKLNDTVQRFNEQIRIDTSVSKNINWDSLIFVIPNGDYQTNTRPNIVPSSPNLYSSFNQKSDSRNSMRTHQYPSTTSIPTSTSYYPSAQRPNGRSASVSMSSRPRSYTCICCKTLNEINENGRSFCSVCRSPAPF